MAKVKVNKKKTVDSNRMLELVRLIKEREREKKKLEAEIEAAKDEIKQVMTAVGVDTLTVDVFTVRYQSVVSRRFDTSAFKNENEGVYEKYLTESSSMKFTIT